MYVMLPPPFPYSNNFMTSTMSPGASVAEGWPRIHVSPLVILLFPTEPHRNLEELEIQTFSGDVF